MIGGEEGKRRGHAFSCVEMSGPLLKGVQLEGVHAGWGWDLHSGGGSRTYGAGRMRGAHQMG